MDELPRLSARRRLAGQLYLEALCKVGIAPLAQAWVFDRRIHRFALFVLLAKPISLARTLSLQKSVCASSAALTALYGEDIRFLSAEDDLGSMLEIVAGACPSSKKVASFDLLHLTVCPAWIYPSRESTRSAKDLTWKQDRIRFAFAA